MASATVRRIQEYLGLKRSLATLIGISILLGVGERLGSRYLPKYLEALGAGALLIGAYGSLENFMGALWSYPGGWLCDKFGVRTCLAYVNAVALAGFLLVALVESRWAVLVGAMLFMGWSAFSLPAGLKLVADQLPRGRRAMGVSMQSLARRFPRAIGPLLGGLLITWLGLAAGVRVAFAFAACLALLAMVLERTMASGEQVSARPLPPDAGGAWSMLNPPLGRLLVSDILVRFCAEIPGVFVILWVMNVAGQSALTFGALTFVEMTIAMVLYIPVAHFSDRMERKPFVLVTFFFFSLFPVLLYFSHGLMMLYVAFVVRGLKEIGEPTRKALIAELAGDSNRGRIVGIYYTARDGTVTLAPLLGGILWAYSPDATLWVAALFGALGTAYFGLFGRDAVPSA
jgi:MFS family permease